METPRPCGLGRVQRLRRGGGTIRPASRAERGGCKGVARAHPRGRASDAHRATDRPRARRAVGWRGVAPDDLSTIPSMNLTRVRAAVIVCVLCFTTQVWAHPA